jgi:hypothetical protein
MLAINFLDPRRLLGVNKMFRCEREDCKNLYLARTKHNHIVKKRTMGDVVIKIWVGDTRKIWYGGKNTIDAYVMETGEKDFRQYENSSKGSLIPRMNALMIYVNKLQKEERWYEAEGILENMKSEMDEKSAMSNWHLNEEIFEKRTLNLKKINLVEELEDLKREYLTKRKMLDAQRNDEEKRDLFEIVQSYDKSQYFVERLEEFKENINFNGWTIGNIRYWKMAI